MVPYLTTQGIGMRQFMELQAVFAIVILSGEVPSGLLSDLWGRKKTLLLGSTLKAVSFSLLPLWSSYEGFLFYHLTMGIALSMISGGDVALLYDSYLADGGEKSRGTALLGNVKLAAQMGTTPSALLGGAVVTLSYGHLLWANAILSWIPVLLVLGITEPPASYGRPRSGPRTSKRSSPRPSYGTAQRGSSSSTWSRGSGGLVMVWMNQKYWQESGGAPGLVRSPVGGLRSPLRPRREIRGARREEIRSATVARRVGVLPIVAYFGMASFLGWGGILLGTLCQMGRGLGGVLFLEALNERISSAFRATVISLSQLGVRASFCLLGPSSAMGSTPGDPVRPVALGLLFSIAFVCLLLPVVYREEGKSWTADRPSSISTQSSRS